MKYKFNIPKQNSTKVEFIKWRFNELNITIESLAELVYQGQVKYSPKLKKEDCIDAVKSVLNKREIQHTLLTAINLDVLAEQNLLLGPLQNIVLEDRGTFGVDETLIDISALYGTIALSNSFYLDKAKPGIIGEIDKIGKNTDYCCTFLDDMLCVIVGCAIGKIAHLYDKGNPIEEEELNLF